MDVCVSLCKVSNREQIYRGYEYKTKSFDDSSKQTLFVAEFLAIQAL